MRFSTVPKSSHAFTLSASDALAWERLPRDLTGTQQIAFGLILILGCGGFALLPHRWVEGWKFYAWLVLVALFAYISTRLVFDLIALYRARQRFPQPVTVSFEDWQDYFVWREDGKPRRVTLEQVLTIIRANEHVFVPTRTLLMILPRSAFAPGELEALSQRLRIALRDPEAFSPRKPSDTLPFPRRPAADQLPESDKDGPDTAPHDPRPIDDGPPSA